MSSRRSLLQTLLTTATVLSLPPLQAAERGRLTARPTTPRQLLGTGEHVLASHGGRNDVLYIPASVTTSKPAPLVVMLHGARGDGDRSLAQEKAAADEHGVIVLSPSSHNGTWDAIRNNFSEDFAALDKLLQQVFDSCNIDKTRLAIGGMSDGGTYGLSLGLINGDLFTHVIAHSPGFIIADNWHGKPKIYVSHGKQDKVLPFDQCGAAIAARLKSANYNVRFDVFDGGHTASPEIRSAALKWMG